MLGVSTTDLCTLTGNTGVTKRCADNELNRSAFVWAFVWS